MNFAPLIIIIHWIAIICIWSLVTPHVLLIKFSLRIIFDFRLLFIQILFCWLVILAKVCVLKTYMRPNKLILYIQLITQIDRILFDAVRTIIVGPSQAWIAQHFVRICDVPKRFNCPLAVSISIRMVQHRQLVVCIFYIRM